MTENTKEVQLDPIIDDEQKRIQCNQDFLFTIMVSELNRLAAPIDNEIIMSKSVTVFLNGAVISGLLVSGVEYGRIFVKKLKDGYSNANIIGNFSAFSQEHIETMVSPYEKMFEQFYKGERPEDSKTTFFHMKDITIKHPDGSFSKFDMFRGKIQDVNGFTNESFK
jgi:hypothetical protein